MVSKQIAISQGLTQNQVTSLSFQSPVPVLAIFLGESDILGCVIATALETGFIKLLLPALVGV